MRALLKVQGWSPLMDRHGNARRDIPFTVKNLDDTPATVYVDATGSTPLIGLVTGSTDGAFPGWMDVGSYKLSYDSITVQVEILSGRGVTAGAGAIGTTELADGAVTAAKVNGALKPSVSAATGTEALRALGTAAGQALPGNHASVTDARTPTDDSVTPTKLKGSPSPSAGQGVVWDGSAWVAASKITDPGGSNGAILVRSGGNWAALAVGSAGDFLMVRSDGTVKWTKPTPIHMTAWGVVGGGLDETAKAQAAIDAAGGMPVVLPPFELTISNRLTSNADNFTLMGYGKSSIINLLPGSNSNVLRFNTGSTSSGAGMVRVKNMMLRDFDIKMNGKDQAVPGSGSSGCVVAPNCDHFEAVNVDIYDSLSNAWEVRGSSVVRWTRCNVYGVRSGGAGNAFNAGQTGNTNGTDAMWDQCLVSGCQDVAFWCGGNGNDRALLQGCTVRGDAMRYIADGAINIGVNAGLLTSATANFTEFDQGKFITVKGAGPGGADLVCHIFNFISSTSVGLSAAASTSVSGAIFWYGEDGAPARDVVDVSMGAGSNIITSATANFTADDVQKGIFMIGATGPTAGKVGKISAVTNSTTATVDFTNTTGSAISNKFARINCTSSGLMAEGGAGNSRHLEVIGGHVIGTVNIGIGASDANIGGVLAKSKHDHVILDGVTVSDTFGAAGWFTGRQVVIGNITMDNIHGSGLSLGQGNDFEEGPFVVNGGSIKMAADATGPAIWASKDGGNANSLIGILLAGVILDGGGGTSPNGLQVEGRIKGFEAIGVQARRFKNSGAWVRSKGGAAPARIRFLGGFYNNNNQGANAAGVNSAGIAFEAGSDIRTRLVTATDDQGTKTQTHGLYIANGVTDVESIHDELSGNLTADVNDLSGGQFRRKRDVFMAAAPTSGTWAVGDKVWNTAPAVGGTIGWVCTAAGTPGSWKTFGPIEQSTVLEAFHLVGGAGEPAFGTGWSNVGGGHRTLSFCKTADGLVHVTGVVVKTVSSGFPADTIFTLPAGYRPVAAEKRSALIYTGSAFNSADIKINTDGTVVLNWLGASMTSSGQLPLALMFRADG